jgi:hypothetical protein
MLQWLYTHVASVCFMLQVIWMLQKYISLLHNMHIAIVCFKCFRCFIRMLLVFRLDVAKVDLGVAYVCNGLQVFSGVFVSVLDVYCKSFRHILQVFHLNVAKVGLMLHMLRWDPLAIATCLAARALPSGCRHPGEGSYRAPNFGSFVHYVSVPGSVVDTHNSNKIDIKKTYFHCYWGKHITGFMFI